MHARGRAPPRGRARAAHAPGPHRARPRARAAAPAAALMAGALDWDAERTRREVGRLARARRGGARRRGRARRRRARSPRIARRWPSAPTRRRGDRARPRARPGHLEHALRRARRGARASAASASVAGRVVVSRAPGCVEQDPEAIAASAERAIAGALAAAGAGAGRRRGARHRQPDGDVRGLGPRDRRAPSIRRSCGRTGGPTTRAPRCAQGTRSSCASAPGSSSTRPSRRRSCAGCSTSVGAPRRGGSRTATSPRGSCTGSAGVHVMRRRQRRALAAVPARRAPTGTTSCSSCSASRARCCRRSWTRTRIDAAIAGVPVRAAAGRPAGVAVRAALLGARRGEGDAGDRRVRARPGGRRRRRDRRPASSRSCAWRREGDDELRARGLHPHGRRGGGLVRPHRRAARRPRSSTRCCARRGGRPGVVCVPALPGPRQPELGRGRPRRPARPQPRHHPCRPRPRGRRRRPPPGRRRGRGDRRSRTLWVDGGLSRSDWIVQRLADLAGAGVQRTARADSTALGAATLAGLAAGVWPSPEALPEIPLDLCAEPQMAAAERDRERDALGRGARAHRPALHPARIPLLYREVGGQEDGRRRAQRPRRKDRNMGAKWTLTLFAAVVIVAVGVASRDVLRHTRLGRGHHPARQGDVRRARPPRAVASRRALASARQDPRSLRRLRGRQQDRRRGHHRLAFASGSEPDRGDPRQRRRVRGDGRHCRPTGRRPTACALRRFGRRPTCTGCERGRP